MKSLYSYITEQCNCKKKKCECPKKTVDALEKIASKEEIKEAKKETVNVTGVDPVGNIVVSVDCSFTDSEIQAALKKFKYNIQKDCYVVKITDLRKNLPEKASKMRLGLVSCERESSSNKSVQFTTDKIDVLLTAANPLSDSEADFFVFIPKKSVKEYSSALANKTINYGLSQIFKNVFKNLK